MIEIVYFVDHGKPRGHEVSKSTNNVMGLHIFRADVVVVHQKDAGVVLPLHLPLLMQRDKVSGIGSQDGVSVLCSIA